MKKRKKFAIVAPEFDERIGGIICLYKLCEILNKLGYDAYLLPWRSSINLEPGELLRGLLKFIKREIIFYKNLILFKNKSRFEVNRINWFDFCKNKKEYIVVYPEVVSGNPFGAEHVVRWLLHQPGFHTKFVGYGIGEFLVKFNSAINDFSIYSSYSYDKYLKVIDYPIELYKDRGEELNRSGVAYCIRKGKFKKLDKHPSDAILIDGKSHAEVAKIFKKVEYFISYDDYTAYSLFAILAGCKSIVIPADGISEEKWYQNVEDRFGIAYGMDNMKWAEDTKELQVERIIAESKKVDEAVKCFAEECGEYFSGRIQADTSQM